MGSIKKDNEVTLLAIHQLKINTREGWVALLGQDIESRAKHGNWDMLGGIFLFQADISNKLAFIIPFFSVSYQLIIHSC